MLRTLTSATAKTLFGFIASPCILSGLAYASPEASSITRLAKPKVFNAELTSPGFVLYPVEGNSQVWLVNMSGQLVHKWKIDAPRARLLPNGELLALHGTRWGKALPEWRMRRSLVRRYNPKGEVVWEYKSPLLPHHDVVKLVNENILVLIRSHVPDILRPQIRGRRGTSREIWGDGLFEVDSSGQVVWDWHTHEHLDLNDCGVRECDFTHPGFRPPPNRTDWTHGNAIQELPENHWYDNGDTRFRPGNILFMARNLNRAMIIDRDSGEVVWTLDRIGDRVLGGGHEPNMIRKGRPGAGNILIFNNWIDGKPNTSEVWEVDPVENQIVWDYQDPGRFYSRTAGAVQRLPNGNTFISQDKSGRVFEITPEGEIVWEFKAATDINRARKYLPDASVLLKSKPLGRTPGDTTTHHSQKSVRRHDGRNSQA